PPAVQHAKRRAPATAGSGLALLAASRAGPMPHAWLIGGPRGIGKATLAYRMARFVFAHSDASAAEVSEATSLALPPDHPTVRRIAAQGHPDLLALERVEDEKGKMPTMISVDLVRRTIGFFGSTAGGGAWGVSIWIPAASLTPAGPNPLRKILEDP